MSGVNVLFNSVGRRVELMRSFKQAYEVLDLEGSIVALDVDPLAPALQMVDRYYYVPRLDDPHFVPALVEICRQEQIDLVFPLIDPGILVLARHREEIEAIGARVAAVSQEAAELTADKWKTYEFFRELGIPTPFTWLPSRIDPSMADYPLFVKPRHGSASISAFKVCDERELTFFLDYVSNPIVQEYLPGPEITNDVLCNLEGCVIAVVSRQRIEVRWGEVAKGVTVYDREITEACVKIAQALKAIGPITVQCILKDGIPHFTEINARFGGGAPLGIAAGADYPRWLLAEAASLPVEVPPLGSYQVGLHLTRHDESLFLVEAEEIDLRGLSERASPVGYNSGLFYQELPEHSDARMSPDMDLLS